MSCDLKNTISFEEAIQIITQNTPVLKTENVNLLQALGRVVSKDILAPFASPRFDHSAVDGYCVRAQDLSLASPQNPVFLKVKGIQAAGQAYKSPLLPKETFRIFTGAPTLPEGNAVIMQEDVRVDGDQIKVISPIQAGAHIRKMGEEFSQNQILIPQKTLLTPAHIGLLATFGLAQVRVYCKPRVSLIISGNELVSVNNIPSSTSFKNTLKEGQIFDSNAPMLISALHQMGIHPTLITGLADEATLVKKALAKAF
jgi:molybdopterin molybdotransferase